MTQARVFEVSEEDAGTRLDVWLGRRMPEISRSRIQAMIREGMVVGGDEPLVKPNTRVHAGVAIAVSVHPPEPVALQPESIPLDVIYEDREIVVINKPAGLVVHPAAGHSHGTLVNALLAHCKDLSGIGGELRPGIVHRLDKDTSGVMVIAKTQQAMDSLGAQFRAGDVHKEYFALVRGTPRKLRDRVETQIGRSRNDRKKMAVLCDGGRVAITHYEVERVLGEISLVRVKIETGRTHQIRVHMSHIGHPIVGDSVYGGRKRKASLPVRAPRQMLHAASLSFLHPREGDRRTFEAPLPADMRDVLDACACPNRIGGCSS
jgi:23S rRNA pseudouridine1911/1915/1917 synthase